MSHVNPEHMSELGEKSVTAKSFNRENGKAPDAGFLFSKFQQLLSI